MYLQQHQLLSGIISTQSCPKQIQQEINYESPLTFKKQIDGMNRSFGTMNVETL